MKGEKGKEIVDMKAMQDGSRPPPVFTHADLNPTNVLVHGQSIAGIIDWQKGIYCNRCTRLGH
jgi:aminoglycoside phosphotransferase (APT) family kinase protein